MFPWITPVPNPEDSPDTPTSNQQVEAAKNLSPHVRSMMEHNPYLADLEITDPTIHESNLAIAERVQQVSQIEETDRLLKEMTQLDQRELKAKTNIHENLSKHKQFLAQNHNALQLINQNHVLQMAGHHQQQVTQQAQYTGLTAARAAIANRMRG